MSVDCIVPTPAQNRLRLLSSAGVCTVPPATFNMDVCHIYPPQPRKACPPIATALARIPQPSAAALAHLAQETAARSVRSSQEPVSDRHVALAFLSLNDGQHAPFTDFNRGLADRTSAELEHYKWCLFHTLDALRALQPYAADTIYRPVDDLPEAVLAEVYKKGATLVWRSFGIALTDEISARENIAAANLVGKAPAIFRISGKFRAYEVSDFNYFKGEKELLIEPETRFEVTDVIPGKINVVCINVLEGPLLLGTLLPPKYALPEGGEPGKELPPPETLAKGPAKAELLEKIKANETLPQDVFFCQVAHLLADNIGDKEVVKIVVPRISKFALESENNKLIVLGGSVGPTILEVLKKHSKNEGIVTECCRLLDHLMSAVTYSGLLSLSKEMKILVTLIGKYGSNTKCIVDLADVIAHLPYRDFCTLYDSMDYKDISILKKSAITSILSALKKCIGDSEVTTRMFMALQSLVYQFEDKELDIKILGVVETAIGLPTTTPECIVQAIELLIVLKLEKVTPGALHKMTAQLNTVVQEKKAHMRLAESFVVFARLVLQYIAAQKQSIAGFDFLIPTALGIMETHSQAKQILLPAVKLLTDILRDAELRECAEAEKIIPAMAVCMATAQEDYIFCVQIVEFVEALLPSEKLKKALAESEAAGELVKMSKTSTEVKELVEKLKKDDIFKDKLEKKKKKKKTK